MFETEYTHTTYALPTRFMGDALADCIGVECPEELKHVCVQEGTLDYWAVIIKLGRCPPLHTARG